MARTANVCPECGAPLRVYANLRVDVTSSVLLDARGEVATVEEEFDVVNGRDEVYGPYECAECHAVLDDLPVEVEL